jgi:hypothetical protein
MNPEATFRTQPRTLPPPTLPSGARYSSRRGGGRARRVDARPPGRTVHPTFAASDPTNLLGCQIDVSLPGPS